MQTNLQFDAPLLPTDIPRLTGQLAAVKEVMADGQWHTLQGIRIVLEGKEIHASEAGISARLRDLRKDPWNLIVERRKKENTNGVFEYRIPSSPRPALASAHGAQAGDLTT